MKTIRVMGQDSWAIHSNVVRAWLTRTGGHLGPVEFTLGRRRIQPYAIAPWAEEEIPTDTSAVLRVLRGDFFCFPFVGEGDPPFRGERYPLHGETCNSEWINPRLKRQGGRVTFRTELDLQFRPGHITKEITLQDGHTVVYNRHTISGMSGPVTFAHHPCLAFPRAAGSGLISTSGFVFGQTLPGGPIGDRSALASGAEFKSLARVPLIAGGHTDASRYPARQGFEDLAMIVTRPVKPFAWVAVAFPTEGYVWFTLKDPRVLPSTLFWFSNGGIDSAPLNGRHRHVLGIEDMSSYFALGVAASSKPNPVSQRGHLTHTVLKQDQALEIRAISGVAAIPNDYGRVRSIKPHGTSLVLRSTKGRSVHCLVDHDFLKIY